MKSLGSWAYVEGAEVKRRYKLRSATIADALKKIPADRLEAFADELRDMVLRVAVAQGLVRLVGEDLDPPMKRVRMGRTITWTDDGKSRTSVSVESTDGQVEFEMDIG